MEGKNNTVVNFYCLLIILFHIVGAAGFLLPALTPLFIKLVPFHLLLMLLLVLLAQPGKDAAFWSVSLAIYVAGFLVEYAGVSTGQIFGHYRYGATLGPKLGNVPLMIGVNWVLLVYSVSAVVNLVVIRAVLRIPAGAALLVLLDFFIEPVAVKFNYWSWTGSSIPFQNYAAWFIFSIAILSMFSLVNPKQHNKPAAVLFITQLIFFAVLNLWA